MSDPVQKEAIMWELYRKTALQSMRPYVHGEDLTGVSVSERDTPEPGGMIARGADDGALWYVSKTFFDQNYRPAGDCDCFYADFVKHIQAHLAPGEDVICKICGKTLQDIVNHR